MKTPCRRTRLPIGRVIGRDYADIATRLQWEGNAFTLKRHRDFTEIAMPFQRNDDMKFRFPPSRSVCKTTIGYETLLSISSTPIPWAWTAT